MMTGAVFYLNVLLLYWACSLQVTWSKIVALYAFGARLAQHCSEHRMNDLVYDVASNLAQFAVERITPFLKRNGGWVSS